MKFLTAHIYCVFLFFKFCKMSLNKLALLRYKTIDNCLRNRYRKWTLEDLIEKVSEALYEMEGITTGVGKRTIQADIQLMRSNKLGYNAPIVVSHRKYYSYSDLKYSINSSKVSESDITKLQEIVGVLKQMSGFDYLDEISDIVARLENSIQKTVTSGQNLIQLEGNQLLKGIEHITPLYRAIARKIPLLISYQSFKAAVPSQFVYFPYLLKEYRNRWFLICRKRNQQELMTLALDRIVEWMEMSPKDYEAYEGVDFERYFSDTIGVTKSVKNRAVKVILKVDNQNAPYIHTKPLHTSQQVLKVEGDYTLFRIDVILNFELEREILGFGEQMEVMSPRILRHAIKKRLAKASAFYQ